MVLAGSYGIKTEFIPRMATGFGMGIGMKGSVCGALTGAVMALGLRYGRDDVSDLKAAETCLRKASGCYSRFEKEFGTVLCYDLVGPDLSTPEGMREFMDLGLLEKKCADYVRGGREIFTGLVRHV